MREEVKRWNLRWHLGWELLLRLRQNQLALWWPPSSTHSNWSISICIFFSFPICRSILGFNLNDGHLHGAIKANVFRVLLDLLQNVSQELETSITELVERIQAGSTKNGLWRLNLKRSL